MVSVTIAILITEAPYVPWLSPQGVDALMLEIYACCVASPVAHTEHGIIWWGPEDFISLILFPSLQFYLFLH